ncbi:MAG: D-arabinono-1,4-lactone oxidase [Bacteroidia bacterium]|nr:FAD-binding protein [Bacteroidia bacterium]MDW8016074.1 D-arabinono-1,4-lactone oxidase [Bacteroidia bacterium]
MSYRNWGRTLAFQPEQLLFPKKEEEIVRVIRQAIEEKKTVRVVGAAHSWTPLIETNHILLSLDRMQGLISLSPTQMTATLWAGTRLYRALPALWKAGFSLLNQGDIDRQSIAGAFSTGTHGTGREFGILATQAIHYRFISGEGKIYDVYPELQPELFRALQVSLGLFGVITQVTLQVTPRYYLRLIKRIEPLEVALEQSEAYLEQYRHFEFFWFPYSEVALVKLTEVSETPGQTSWWRRWAVDKVWENGAFWVINKLSQWAPQLSPTLCRFASRNMTAEIRVDKAYRIFASPRWVRFREMEYSVPAAAGPEVLREIRRWIDQHSPAVSFPIEYRYVKGDEIPLSPAYGGDRVLIAVHMYYRMPYERYFRGIESIFQAHEGRPHWGKMHTASSAYLQKVYPELESFLTLRQKYDPQGVFLTPFLQRMLWGEKILLST